MLEAVKYEINPGSASCRHGNGKQMVDVGKGHTFCLISQEQCYNITHISMVTSSITIDHSFIQR